MKAEKALELVHRYSELTKKIKSSTRRISDVLDRCKGISGKRHEVDRFGFPTYERATDSKNREIDLHLNNWYKPKYSVECGDTVWDRITPEKHQAECPHCYAAHIAIQARKEARKSLAGVKAAMTRSTS